MAAPAGDHMVPAVVGATPRRFEPVVNTQRDGPVPVDRMGIPVGVPRQVEAGYAVYREDMYGYAQPQGCERASLPS
jgi:hypothetical protein